VKQAKNDTRCMA